MRPPRIVLIEPQHPANVGFVARVLANYGLDDWALVGGVEWRGSEAERTAAMAPAVLAAAHRADGWAAALDDCTHLLGFTARPGRHRRALALAELAAVRASWGGGARPALIFGREDRGLEAEEAERCGWLVTIPTAGLASLNLSHAVAVALYEWFRELPAAAPAADRRSWSGAADRARLAAKAAAELRASGYPDGGELEAALRRLTARPIEARDLRVLEKIVRHAQYFRQSHGPRP